MAEKRDGTNLAEAMSYMATEPFVLYKVQEVRNEIPAASDTPPAEAGTASAGASTEYSRGDHVHPAETRIQAYSLPDDCFPITYTEDYEGQIFSRTVSSNDGIEFYEEDNYINLYDIAAQQSGGYALFCVFNRSTLKYTGSDAPISSLKFNGVSPIANTSPTLRADAVYVRDVQVAKESDVAAGLAGKIGNSGTQTIQVGDNNYKIVFGADAGGTFVVTYDDLGNPVSYGYHGISAGGKIFRIPSSAGTLALVSQIYAVVQQIAPEFTAKAYALNDLCSYEGVVYRCKSAYTATSSSAKPSSDTTHWEAKKVSELFLPLTGGSLKTGAGITFGNGSAGGSYTIKAASVNEDGIVKIFGEDGGGPVLVPYDAGTLALLQNLAANYSTSATYALNTLCVRSGTLYRCTTAITTAEAWTAAHWTEATVEDVLAIIRSALNDKAPLSSPAFTGTPTAPTPTTGDNSHNIADTAFVQNSASAVRLTEAADVTRYYTEWSDPVDADDTAGGYALIYFTPTAFGATANCVVRSVTVKSASTAGTLPTVPVYAKIIDPDATASALAVSQPVTMSATTTDYTFVFDKSPSLTYNKQYRLVFYSGAADGSAQVAVGVSLRVMSEAGTREECEKYVDAIIEAMKASGHLIEVKK